MRKLQHQNWNCYRCNLIPGLREKFSTDEINEGERSKRYIHESNNDWVYNPYILLASAFDNSLLISDMKVIASPSASQSARLIQSL